MDEQDSHDVVVKISLTTIYAKLLEVEGIVRPLPAAQTDQEARLRVVEKAQAFAAGRAGVVGFLAGSLAAWIINKIGGA